MRVPIYQVDAFTSRPFGGNPAAVCPLERWPADALLQSIASENNLSETAFLVPEGEGWHLRWFTPTVEVDLCGHATLAAAHVVLTRLSPARESVSFRTASGVLTVKRAGGRLSMTLPRLAPERIEPPPGLARALGVEPLETWRSHDLMAVLASEELVRDLAPDLAAVAGLDAPGLIVTAQGRAVDFVSRYFGPRLGLPEDPVTGSAHCTLVPYWAERLGKSRLHAFQVSARGGELFCQSGEDLVVLAGHVADYLEGVLQVPEG
ncbi:MAG TPA: PhzF family phenazine biosynthesis protein [Anaeromyxobacteraceae bacterium]|jgi:PhzF family phenazine biosynthesis protein|nr:PhzF family phenazine biosynthesis protein [Anaeromyxobacteraceae bacterium]